MGVSHSADGATPTYRVVSGSWVKVGSKFAILELCACVNERTSPFILLGVSQVERLHNRLRFTIHNSQFNLFCDGFRTMVNRLELS